MAYIDQQKKKELLPQIKTILKKYGLKGSLSIRNHMTLVLKIKSGPIDFGVKDYIQVNEYYIDEHYTGIAKDCLLELKEAMNVGNYDHSDIQSDYFCVGWYTNIYIGSYDQPYRLLTD